MLENVNSHIRSLNWSYKKALNTNKVRYFNCLASIETPHVVALRDKKGDVTRVTAKFILLAMGGRPSMLDVPGALELCITSDDLFWRQKPPGRTLVIGAGYIAMECSGFLRLMGYEVDVLYRSVVMREFDQEMARRIMDHMAGLGVKFKNGQAQRFDKEGNQIKATIKLHIEDKIFETTELYDTVLLAVTRTPDTKNLGLEKFGIKFDKLQKLVVDQRWQTSVPWIYAVGDIVSGANELTPLAIKEGEYVTNGLFANHWEAIDYKAVPTTVFTPLEYSSCGYTEEKANSLLGSDNIDVYHSSFKPLEWNFLSSHPSNLCYTKVIIEKVSQKIIGIHFLGPNAGEVMQGFAVFVRLGLRFEEL